MFSPNDEDVEDAQKEATNLTISLGDLPRELITEILSATEDAVSISCLARTCSSLACIANYILYRTSFLGTDPMKWAVDRDQLDTAKQILTYRTTPTIAISPQNLSAHLIEALRAGSFRTADILLDAGAEIIYTAGSRPALRSEEVVVQNNGSHPRLGSLALAARNRYHLTFWYRSTKPYASEAEYWRWKKTVMTKILARMRGDVSRRHLEHPVLCPEEYQRELDIALIEAANSDAHSIEMMDVLLAAGANIDAEMNDQYVGQVWRNALDEEVPSLFRAKVDFLMERGVTTNRVWSLQVPLTTAEFFLKKLHSSCPFTTDASFIDRSLWMMDWLERRGYLEWPPATFEALNTRQTALQQRELVELETGAGRELGLILDDAGEFLKPLQMALKNHLNQKLIRGFMVTSEKIDDHDLRRDIGDDSGELGSVDMESLPKAILRLEKLREEWLAEGC